jgi:energy-coupling factor transporter ATP-binding protein EcfA2
VFSHIVVSRFNVRAKSDERKKIVNETLREFELLSSKDTKFMRLSGGQTKGLQVAELFVYKPKLAIFDEPTTMVALDGCSFCRIILVHGRIGLNQNEVQVEYVHIWTSE